VIRNLIFDWSGTLVDDLSAVWQTVNHVLKQAGREEVTLDRFRDDFCPSFSRFYADYLSHVEPAQVTDWFNAHFPTVQDSVVALPYAREFLEFARAQGMRMVVLTAVHESHFVFQARATGFGEFFQRAYTGVWEKTKQIHDVLREQVFDPAETLFIGDTQQDIETAKHGGVRSCAVLTGYQMLAQLRASQPDIIVEHLGELQRILAQNRFELGGTGNALPVVTVGALIFNSRREVLMIRTHKWSNLWGIPGGKVKWGESSFDALRREVKEETNLDVSDIQFVIAQDCIHSKEFYRDAHFVLLNYTCRCAEPYEVRLNEEANDHRWVSPAAALQMDLNTPTRILLEAIVAPK
jgi:phosphoglycolate phosphatase-like HAD superfamily hydrolase/ADP-ribose pyrophosphatase YjhB (NUDIX family)